MRGVFLCVYVCVCIRYVHECVVLCALCGVCGCGV